MIRKLTDADSPQVLPFLKQSPSKTLFILGDIEIYGFETDFQELWGEFDENNQIKAVLLRYYDGFTLYGFDYDAMALVQIIQQHPHTIISGDQQILKPLLAHLNPENYQPRETYFAEVTKTSLEKHTKDSSNVGRVKTGTVDDALRIATLESSIEEFSNLKDPQKRAEQIRKKFESKAGRTYYIEEDEQIVSIASSTAENSLSAMIIGVATSEGYRKRGYTSAILSKLLADLLVDKESVCLFYDNPKAGNIYKRAGFQDIGMWTMIEKK